MQIIVHVSHCIEKFARKPNWIDLKFSRTKIQGTINKRNIIDLDNLRPSDLVQNEIWFFSRNFEWSNKKIKLHSTTNKNIFIIREKNATQVLLKRKKKTERNWKSNKMWVKILNMKKKSNNKIRNQLEHFAHLSHKLIARKQKFCVFLSFRRFRFVRSKQKYRRILLRFSLSFAFKWNKKKRNEILSVCTTQTCTHQQLWLSKNWYFKVYLNWKHFSMHKYIHTQLHAIHMNGKEKSVNVWYRLYFAVFFFIHSLMNFFFIDRLLLSPYLTKIYFTKILKQTAWLTLKLFVNKLPSQTAQQKRMKIKLKKKKKKYFETQKKLNGNEEMENFDEKVKTNQNKCDNLLSSEENKFE